MSERDERARIIAALTTDDGFACNGPRPGFITLDGDWTLDELRAALRGDASEPVAWAPYMEDEDIPTPADGLLYEGDSGRLIAFRSERAALDSMVHKTALPLFAHPPEPSGIKPEWIDYLEEMVTDRARCICCNADDEDGGCATDFQAGWALVKALREPSGKRVEGWVSAPYFTDPRLTEYAFSTVRAHGLHASKQRATLILHGDDDGE